MKKIIKTVIEEFKDDKLVKRTETTETYDNYYEQTFPSLPTQPYYNPVIYTDTTGKTVPNPNIITCKG
ncbi:MAG TPA: hypothetical protein VIK86_08000 [Candidatus Paceibacterota bacterium]